MANIVIVSSHCYLLCEAIHYISLDIKEDDWSYRDHKDRIFKLQNSKKSRQKTISEYAKLEEERRKKLVYQITVNFRPSQQATNNGRADDERSLIITIPGLADAEKVYKEIVGQIREQLPDQLFLDSLVDRLFQAEKGDSDDRSTEKVR